MHVSWRSSYNVSSCRFVCWYTGKLFLFHKPISGCHLNMTSLHISISHWDPCRILIGGLTSPICLDSILDIDYCWWFLQCPVGFCLSALFCQKQRNLCMHPSCRAQTGVSEQYFNKALGRQRIQLPLHERNSLLPRTKDAQCFNKVILINWRFFSISQLLDYSQLSLALCINSIILTHVSRKLIKAFSTYDVFISDLWIVLMFYT